MSSTAFPGVYPDEPPQWSDWTTLELGYADTPNAIECRGCHHIKPTSPLHFRRKTGGLRWQTTCRRCENISPYMRSLNVRIKRILDDPSLPAAMKTYEIERLPALKSAALKARTAKLVHARFRTEWTLVRKIIVVRKAMLINNIDQSKARLKHGGTGIKYAMDHSWRVHRYIEALLAAYSFIIGRMRRMEAWHALIGDHYPPPAWSAAIQRCAEAEKAGLPFPRDAVLWVNPWMLLTRDERSRVRDADPAQDEPVDMYWRAVLDARPHGPLKWHLYPWRYPEGNATLADDTPAWLREFNGIDKKETS